MNANQLLQLAILRENTGSKNEYAFVCIVVQSKAHLSCYKSENNTNGYMYVLPMTGWLSNRWFKFWWILLIRDIDEVVQWTVIAVHCAAAQPDHNFCLRLWYYI